MENQPFVDAYHEINTRLIRLIGSMSALRELSSLEHSLCSESELLDESLRIVLENHELDYVVVYLDKEGKLQQQAFRQWEQVPEIPQASHSVLQKLAEKTIELNSIQYLQDIDMDSDHGSAICLPISTGNNRFGVLCAYYPDVDFFTPAHERSLLIFCNFLAQSVMNNRLLHDMEKLVQQRTDQLQSALSEARKLKQRYEELAIIDELTTLHNRRFFFPEARTAVASAIRYEKKLSIMMIDIDHFKQVNDMYGHAMGDQVLQAIASVLVKGKREVDILARFGGEEFVMLLPETDKDGAAVFAERLRRDLQQLVWQVDESEFHITASFGISSLLSPERIEPQKLLDILIQQADDALYYSKNSGRNKIQCYDDIVCEI